MQLIIHDPNTFSGAKERFETHWELAMKKTFRLWMLRPLVGIFLIILALTSPYNTSTYTVTTPQGSSAETFYFNLNLFLAIGIVMVLYSILEFSRIRSEKKKQWMTVLRNIDQSITIELTDQSIRQQGSGITSIVEWRRISSYSEVNNFLFFDLDDGSSKISLDLRLLIEEDRMRLKQFLHSRNLLTP